MTNENRIDDFCPSKSRFKDEWTVDDKFIWIMEVREHLAGANLRLGEITLRGSFDGTLTLAITEVGFTL